jgi:ATP-dependent Lon protease
LAYTTYGGEILKISASMYLGDGKVKVTGSVGKVMEESVEVAVSYIKSNASNFGLNFSLFNNHDIHIHIEEGATPKDGPSAGIAIVTTLISLFKDKVIASDMSMTGEMTLRGKILPIGGLKEKLIAASVNNIKRVFIPVENKVDIEKIPEEVKKNIEVVFVSDYLEIYYYLFGKYEEKENKNDD